MFPPIETPSSGQFGETVSQPMHREGVCPSEDVMGLLSACAVKDEMGSSFSSVTFPFQAFARGPQGRWILRVEPAASHLVGGQSVFGHRWAFSVAGSDEFPNR